MVRYYVVRGRVQGVGFRWFVHREAAALGLKGWVRNMEDGRVELVAAGEPSQLARLRDALYRGSRGSRVDAVEEVEVEEKAVDDLKSFQIEGAW